MKGFLIFILISFIIQGCVSQAKFNDLKIQKEKAIIKTEKAQQKLKALQIYNQHLQDSLNNGL